jgi:hypothetical protein
MKTLATRKRIPGIALVVIGLFLVGGGPAIGATLYGTARDNPGRIYEIDTLLGSTGDLGVSMASVDPAVDPISELSPNGIALDPTSQRFFCFFSRPREPRRSECAIQ